jgi:hypothetical protein
MIRAIIILIKFFIKDFYLWSKSSIGVRDNNNDYTNNEFSLFFTVINQV